MAAPKTLKEREEREEMGVVEVAPGTEGEMDESSRRGEAVASA